MVKWDSDAVIEESRKYGSKSDFKKFSGYAYKVAIRLGLLKCMTWLPSKITEWDYDSVMAEAVKYKTRSEFQKNARGAYNYARKHCMLDSMDWFEKKDPYRDNVYTVYAYLDPLCNAVYIGITVNIKNRHLKHCHDRNSQVYRHFASDNRQIPEPTVIYNEVSQIEALDLEDRLVNQYRLAGYNVLNKAKTGVGPGSVGSVGKKWTDRRLEEEAGRYSSCGEFKKANPYAYKRYLKIKKP